MVLPFYLDTDRSATFGSSVTGTAFNSASDASIKEDVSECTPEECQNIFGHVEVKRYLRTESQQRRVGLIAQDVESACKDDWACLLGTTLKEMPGEDDNTSKERILTLDYARLVTVLWGTLKAQQARLSALEVKVNEMSQKANTRS